MREMSYWPISLIFTGQTLFTKTDPPSLANMDKQIYRIIGKAITLAAQVSLSYLLPLILIPPSTDTCVLSITVWPTEFAKVDHS